MFKNKEDKKITITREEYRKVMAEILSNPFGDKDVGISGEDKAKMQLSLMLNGMLLFHILEDKLFGEE